MVQLGPIGIPEGKELNDTLELYKPKLLEMFEKENLKPSPYDEIGTGGFEDAIDALTYQKSGAGGGNKVIVQIQPVEKGVDFLV